ncbi:MAG: rhomboid family intramembrane serine protease [Dehalococcoidia bacterium]|nr:rhomboid family intramembrane serine protease [Dehalococcoidia bacterium]
MIPVGDSSRRRTTPWVNYAIILVNIGVFIYMLTLSTALPPSAAIASRDFRKQTAGPCYGFETAPTQSDRFVCKYAFQPKEWFDNLRGHSDVSAPDRPVIFFSILAALFLHAGWLHIGGNMLFLWVFGDNVEDRMGHAGYLLFYLVAGIAASLVQGAIDTTSVVPVLGASGAIAGVLGAYLIYFPRATISVVIPFFILVFIPLPIPAWLVIGLWFVQNLFAGVASINQAASPDTSVAFFAHVGGFIFGMLAVILFARGRPRRT